MDGNTGSPRRVPLSPYAAPEEVSLDSQQIATVRAALEWYIQCGLGDHARRPLDIAELANASGGCNALTEAGLARLQGLLDDARRVKLRWPLRA